MKKAFVLTGLCSAFAFLAVSQASGTIERASAPLSSKYTLVLECKAAHPYLAEYDRTLKLLANEKVVATKKIFMDTGGHKSARLYKLSPTLFVVDDSIETSLVDTRKKQITRKNIPAAKRGTYVGTFKDNTSHVWGFFPAPRLHNTRIQQISCTFFK